MTGACVHKVSAVAAAVAVAAAAAAAEGSLVAVGAARVCADAAGVEGAAGLIIERAGLRHTVAVVALTPVGLIALEQGLRYQGSTSTK